MISAEFFFWSGWLLIVYSYFAFPLLLAAAARWRGTPDAAPAHPESPTDLPRVALVVSAYNEEANIAAKLANAWKLDYPADRLELWVGADGCSDSTAAILAADPDPRLRALIFEQRRGKQSVLADLVSRIDAPILVMSDANGMLAPDAVRKLVRHLEQPHVGIVSGEVQLDQDGGGSGEGLYWKYESWIKRNESRLGFLLGCNGGLFAIRRELCEPLPSGTIVEDFVLTLRTLEKGYQARFEPAARALEPSCSDAAAEMVRKIRIGAGGFQALGLTRGLLHPRRGLLAWSYWSHKVLRWTTPLLAGAALIANLFLLDQPFYQGTLIAVLGGGLVALKAYLTPAGKLTSRWVRTVGYLYLMNWALFLGFVRWLTGTQRVTWDRARR